MKILISLFFVFSAIAAAAPVSETNFTSGETVPGLRTIFEWEFPKCQRLEIEKKESLSQMKKKSVRFVFLIGRLSPAKCEGTGLRYEIDAHPTWMTHYFVVVDRNVKLKNLEAVK